jgi:hypothetical protein
MTHDKCQRAEVIPGDVAHSREGRNDRDAGTGASGGQMDGDRTAQ